MATNCLKPDHLTPEELAIVERKEDSLVPQPGMPAAPTYSQLMKQKQDFLQKVVQQRQQQQMMHQLQLMRAMGGNSQANQNPSLLNQPSSFPAGNLGNNQQLGRMSGGMAAPSNPPGKQYVQPNAGPLSLPELKELVEKLNMVRLPNQPLLCFPPTTNMNPTIGLGQSVGPQFSSQIGSQNVEVSGQLGLANKRFSQLSLNQKTVGQLNPQLQTTGMQSGQLQTTGLQSGQLQATGMQSGQLQTTGMQSGQLQTTRMQSGQLQTTGMQLGQANQGPGQQFNLSSANDNQA